MTTKQERNAEILEILADVHEKLAEDPRDATIATQAATIAELRAALAKLIRIQDNGYQIEVDDTREARALLAK